MMTRDQMMRLALGMGDEQATTPIFRDFSQTTSTGQSTGQTNSGLNTPFTGTPTVPPTASTPVSGDMVIQALIGGQGSLSNRNAGNVNPGNNNGRVFNPQISNPQSGVQQGWQSLLPGLWNKNASGANPGNNNGRVFNQQIQMPSYGVQQGWQSLLPGLMSVNHPANNPLVQANMFDQRRTPMEGRWGTGATMFSPWGY